MAEHEEIYHQYDDWNGNQPRLGSSWSKIIKPSITVTCWRDFGSTGEPDGRGDGIWDGGLQSWRPCREKSQDNERSAYKRGGRSSRRLNQQFSEIKALKRGHTEQGKRSYSSPRDKLSTDPPRAGNILPKSAFVAEQNNRKDPAQLRRGKESKSMDINEPSLMDVALRIRSIRLQGPGARSWAYFQ
ncbi:hypothetical protein HAX54_047743 [Datura stramonium]|uniref:Uncharacterized protein n=1 Tax=Datura stramonium TaxID=4076 RepID=A0ABS8SUN9_DATST|nr:hypothetical protein [Datura stramonium]